MPPFAVIRAYVRQGMLSIHVIVICIFVRIFVWIWSLVWWCQSLIRVSINCRLVVILLSQPPVWLVPTCFLWDLCLVNSLAKEKFVNFLSYKFSITSDFIKCHNTKSSQHKNVFLVIREPFIKMKWNLFI